jgi:hypothetical protein
VDDHISMEAGEQSEHHTFKYLQPAQGLWNVEKPIEVGKGK